MRRPGKGRRRSHGERIAVNRRICIAVAAALAVVFFAVSDSFAVDKRPVTAEDLWKMKRVGSLDLSPDGKLAAVVVTEYDIEKNKGQGDIWLVATDGSGARRFTTGPTTESSPAWSPCGEWLAFIAKRDGENAQLHVISRDGGEAVSYTDMPLGASNPKWMPGRRAVLFVSETLPGYVGKLDSLKIELDKRKERKVTAKATEDRFYRYWDRWLTDGTTPHLFMVDLETKAVTDLTPEWSRFFSESGGIDYDVSPDGKEIVFSALRHGPPYDSLASDIYVMSVDAPGEARNITPENPADDFSPRYSPDGKYILYGMQKILGFYGDRVRLVRYDRRAGAKTVLTPGWDRSPGDWVVSKDGRTIHFAAEDRAMQSIFSIGIDGGPVKEIYRGGSNGAVRVAPDGRIVFLHNNLSSPNEVYVVKANGRDPRKISSFNDGIVSEIAWGSVENVTFKGFEDADVQMFVLYPPGFDAAKKWPLLILVHGGPHGIFGDEFHFRWNAQAFAAPGYVTAMVNFHGSSSFGQEFTDAITGEHGRKPFVDVMRAADHLVARGFVDEKRMAVGGGSYGGYLASWIGTQTDRFACLINHAGVFDFLAQSGSDITHGRERAYGSTPWKDLERVIRWSPAQNMKNYVTPTLVVHGERDYRVPLGNALEVYGMLKERGVPAKLVCFPDENHWVLTPQNSMYWYGEFDAWLDRWAGAGPR
jgi:dipeptidyl aminopeptidase/acylaminoacyl peptidase